MESPGNNFTVVPNDLLKYLLIINHFEVHLSLKIELLSHVSKGNIVAVTTPIVSSEHLAD